MLLFPRMANGRISLDIMPPGLIEDELERVSRLLEDSGRKKRHEGSLHLLQEFGYPIDDW